MKYWALNEAKKQYRIFAPRFKSVTFGHKKRIAKFQCDICEKHFTFDQRRSVYALIEDPIEKRLSEGSHRWSGSCGSDCRCDENHERRLMLRNGKKKQFYHPNISVCSKACADMAILHICSNTEL